MSTVAFLGSSALQGRLKTRGLAILCYLLIAGMAAALELVQETLPVGSSLEQKLCQVRQRLKRLFKKRPKLNFRPAFFAV
ncbi:hypothetical protein C8J56DRAFT_969947 [Mycena floridula]|nr:hypothetical protein C8J56DRAFT_969947 [Mycena floridula]